MGVGPEAQVSGVDGGPEASGVGGELTAEGAKDSQRNRRVFYLFPIQFGPGSGITNYPQAFLSQPRLGKAIDLGCFIQFSFAGTG